MRAIIVTRHGGPEVLELQDVPDPQPGPGQLLVDVEAAGVNFRDIYEREGRGGYAADPPLGAGAEGAGAVAAVGEGVHEFKEGDRVAWSAAPAGYAEKVLVDEDKAVPVPDGVSTEVAAAALLQGMTAQYLATDTYAVQSGDDVLVHAAAGGVGLLLTQIVKLLGARVVATTSSEEKAALAREAGADHTIGYDGFAERARELLGNRGVAVVYDGIGRATFDESLAALRPRGTMVLYGAASGPVEPFDPARLHHGGALYLTRPGLPYYTATRHELLSRAAQVFGWIADRRLHVRIGARYPLADARRAQEDLAGRRTTGKLILDPKA
ncbi:MAG TPA: quinone oxidoreductase [Solirubrobacteraceae bacterium]|nr:quinone oxidoreductase [Solirubrobacteraceae bacterium]